ncbi:hypothetical protein CQW23_35789 [Capsicum baccatum]|uniref:Exocyst subunit Exo70 family protein n=1 Tax=Capsicum baccatum TaxID=33114 RepID=A0A2G2UUY4_CAPBA|nr:hypothetical protein CQW23_35789 [Capsicum baccatum]
MHWEVLNLKIKDWLNAVDVAMKTLFNGERILSDYVFASNDAIRESCFTEISKDGAMTLFSFPEIVAKNSKKSAEKVFRLLDMYTSIVEHCPDIEATFPFDSESVIRSQALTSLVKLGESIRTALSEFEISLLKESSKTIIAATYSQISWENLFLRLKVHCRNHTLALLIPMSLRHRRSHSDLHG